MASGLSSKRLQLLKDTFPALARVLVLSQRADPVSAVQVQQLEEAAGPLGIVLLNRGVRTADELSAATGTAVTEGAQALVTTIKPSS
jgi:hypothetical protein